MRLEPVRCLLDYQLKRAGKKRSDLARDLRIDRRQLSQYATMEAVMSLPIAVLIADYIGCSPRDLYEWTEVN